MSKYPGRIVTDLAPAGYSVYFDGSGDRIQTASSAALALGSNDFSIEWWERRDVIGSEDTPVMTGDYSSSYASCLLGYSGTVGYISTNGTGFNVFNGPAYVDPVLPNVWNHFVYTRSGTAFRVFMNGKLSNYATASGSVVQNNNRFNIGGTSAGSQFDFPGYISNFRVVIGSIPTQYQTSSTTVGTIVFTPPTQLFPVTNTVLLACNSPSIIDQSSNNIAFTVTGNAAVSTVTPFTAYVPYNPALGASTPGVWTLDEAAQARQTRQWNMYDPYFNLTTLLLRSGSVDGSQNNQFLDSSSNNFTITRNPTSGPNAPTQGTFTPFSQAPGYWSNGFSAAGTQYIYAVTGANTAPGTGAFCAELWYYKTDTNTAGLFGNLENNTDTQWSLAIVSGAIRIQGWNTVFLTATEPSLNQWHHVAVCRSGTTMSIFVDGIRVATGTVSNNFSGTTDFRVGLSIGVGYFNGYISNARFVKGSSVYDPNQLNIAVPTTPLTNIANTTILTCQNNRFIDNGTANSGSGYTVLPVNTPSVQAFSPFYPTAAYTPETIGGSGFFDGTNDWLSLADSAAFTLGSNNFTFECWVYSTLAGQRQFIAGQINSAGANSSGSFTVEKTVGNKLSSLLYSGVTAYAATSSADIPVNAWTHVAFVRDGNTLRQYINGVQDGTIGVTGVTANDSSSQLAIGRAGEFAGVYYYGYISSVRFINGTCLYPNGTTFSSPTAPLPPVANTQLLCNFTNAAITDATGKNVLETVGNAQASTARRNTQLITTPPTAMFFDGTGDSLFIPAPQKENLRFGTGNFTIEFWAWKSANGAQGYDTVISVTPDGTYNGGFAVELSSTRGFLFLSDSAGRVQLNYNPNDSIWHHYAVVRNGNNLTLYRDGVQLATAAYTGTLGVAGNAFIGAAASSAQLNFNGYIDDLRVTKGVARYTGPFTPPRSRLQEQ